MIPVQETCAMHTLQWVHRYNQGGYPGILFCKIRYTAVYRIFRWLKVNIVSRYKPSFTARIINAKAAELMSQQRLWQHQRSRRSITHMILNDLPPMGIVLLGLGGGYHVFLVFIQIAQCRGECQENKPLSYTQATSVLHFPATSKSIDLREETDSFNAVNIALWNTAGCPLDLCKPINKIHWNYIPTFLLWTNLGDKSALEYWLKACTVFSEKYLILLLPWFKIQACTYLNL